MISYLYFACFMVTFCEIIFFLLTSKKPNLNFLLSYVCALLVTYGLWACSIAKTSSEAALGCRIQYLGATWVSFFILLSIADVCKTNLPKLLPTFLFLVNILIMASTLYIGIGDTFYKSIDIYKENGVTYTLKTYGPIHSFFKVMLIVYIIGMLFLTIVGFRRKTTVSYRYSRILLIMVITDVACYFLKSILHSNFNILSITYTISVGILTYLQQRIDLYDADQLVGESGSFDSKGIILLNNDCYYMGCSKKTLELFPEIQELKLEYALPIDEDKFWVNFLPWVNELKQTGKNETHLLELGNRSFRGKVKKYEKDFQRFGIRHLGYVVILWDDTEQQNYIKNLSEYNDMLLVKEKELQKQKAIAENANKTKSAFLSNMSHEIRTPMNAIVGMTEILKRKQFDEETEEYLDNIKHSGEALLAIINDILDFSKVESGKMELVPEDYDLRLLIKELDLIFKTRIGTKEIQMEYDLDNRIPNVLIGDSKRIRQILINIANNAIKFTEKGFVRISVAVESMTEKEVNLKFSVKDSGQGIREEDLPKLFDAYQQVDLQKNSKKEGTGLGLAICSQLVQLMGGSLQVESTYGKGSTFFYSVKQGISTRVLQKSEAHTQTKFTAPEAHILVVDDNKMNLKVFEGLFKPVAMQIDTAMDGQEAIEKVKQQDYDIVFMDHMMPGMDGIEVTATIRQLPEDALHDADYYKRLVILALSANATEDAKQLFLSNGMDGFLSKPIKIQEGLELLRQWLPQEKILEEK